MLQEMTRFLTLEYISLDVPDDQTRSESHTFVVVVGGGGGVVVVVGGGGVGGGVVVLYGPKVLLDFQRRRGSRAHRLGPHRGIESGRPVF